MKIKYILILVPLLCFTFSCNEWLDVKLQTQVEEDDFYSTERGYESSLNGCYLKMKDAYTQPMMMTTIEYLAQQWDDRDVDNLIYLMDFEYENDYVEGVMEDIFSDIYNIIAQANNLLDNYEISGDVIEDEDKRNIIKGEALAIRAFCHFDILRLFGAVPNGTIDVALPYSETFSNQNPPYYYYEDYVEKVLADLTEAEVLLEGDPARSIVFSNLTSDYYVDDDFYMYRNIKFNYFAVQAILARVYMYIGNTEKAAEYAVKVIEATTTGGTSIRTLGLDTDYSNQRYSCPTEAYMVLDVNDIVDKTSGYFELVSTSGSVSCSRGSSQSDIITNIFNDNSLDVRCTSLWYESVNSYGTVQYTIKKYLQYTYAEDSNIGTVGVNRVVPIVRIPEMYLIAAEALAETDLATANSYLYDFQYSRNILPATYDTADDLVEEVVNEYRREFYAEGQMFFTYKRLNYSSMVWRSAQVTEENYIVPLPSTEIVNLVE